MAEAKTKPTDASVEAFFDALPDAARREECRTLARLMARATGQPPRLWGTSIVGFGSYHYRYASGHEGEACVVGFAPRKGELALYGLLAAPDQAELRAQLGRHKTGKGCLYLRRLGDADLAVLARLVAEAFAAPRTGAC